MKYKIYGYIFNRVLNTRATVCYESLVVGQNVLHTVDWQRKTGQS